MELDASARNRAPVSVQSGALGALGALGAVGVCSSVADAPKNKKNMATLSSETTLTARLGCLARTFAASSCTESEMAMRRAISTSRAPKARSPDSVVESVAALDPSHPLNRISRTVTLNVRGSAVNTMLSTSTDAMSSSSLIWASRAASSSSRPMPNETLNAKSDPSDPSAVAVSAIAPHNGVENDELVSHAVVDTALREAHQLPPRLAWQAPSNGGAFLFMRRLLVAPRGIKRGADVGGPMRSQRGRRAYQARHHSGGTVFGCTLGNLMHHCRNSGNKRPLSSAMHLLRRALVPAGRALATCSGEDVPFLVRGMACHRVLAAQGKLLRELKRAPNIDSKTGHVGVVLGLSAAVLVAFECIAATPEDCGGMGAQLSSCLREAQTALVAWRLPHICDEDVHLARGVEIRALERARIAVARAQETGHDLDAAAAIRLQLDGYRRAVWPEGEELSAHTHESVLKRIRSGELVDLERDVRVRDAAAPPGIATLWALPSELGDRGDRGDRDSESVSGTGSSWGSWGSWGSWSSSASSTESHTGAPPHPDMERIAAAFQSQVLSPAARAAVARPLTISSRPMPEHGAPQIT